MKQFTILELMGAIAFTAFLSIGAISAWFIHIYNM